MTVDNGMHVDRDGTRFPVVELWLARAALCGAVIFVYSMISSSLGHGSLQAGDDSIHSALTLETSHMLSMGRSLFDWSYIYGLGAPKFIFRPPGFYIAVQLLHLVSFGQVPLMLAHKLIYALGFMLYPVGVYYMLSKFRFPPIACGIAALLATTPISTFGHTIDAYYDLGLAKQVLAILIFPFAVGKLHGVISRGERIYPCAMMFGAMFLCHPYMGWSFTLVAAVYLSVHSLMRQGWKSRSCAIGRTTAVILLGAAMSAFWLVPFYSSDEIHPTAAFSSSYRHALDVRAETAARTTDHLLQGGLLDRSEGPGDVFGRGSPWAWRDNSGAKRWPILSWFSVIGFIAMLTRYRSRGHVFFATAWIASLLIFMGPDDLPLLRLVPFQNQFQYIHFVAVLELFSICLAAYAVHLCVLWTWRCVSPLLVRLRVDSFRTAVLYVLASGLIGALILHGVLSERYAYGRLKARTRSIEFGPDGQTEWSRRITANRVIEDATSCLANVTDPYQRFFARAGDVHSGISIFHYTLAPSYVHRGNLIAPLIVGIQGGVNSIVNMREFSGAIWKSPVLLDLFNVGALLTSSGEQAYFPFDAGVYDKQHQFIPWIVYERDQPSLPFGVSTVKPILVAGTARQWEQVCTDWLRRAKDLSPDDMRRFPFLIWKRATGEGDAIPVTRDNCQSVFFASSLLNPDRFFDDEELGDYGKSGGVIAARLPRTDDAVPSWATTAVAGISDVMRMAAPGERPPQPEITDILQEYGLHSATVNSPYACIVYFKAAFYRGWEVCVDGDSTANISISPGFNGCRVSPGRHHIEFRYKGANGAGLGMLIAVLAVLSIPATVAAGYFIRRRRSVSAGKDTAGVPASIDVQAEDQTKGNWWMIAPAALGIIVLLSSNYRQRIQHVPIPTLPLTGDIVNGTDLRLAWNELPPGKKGVQVQVSKGDKRFSGPIIDTTVSKGWNMGKRGVLEPGQTYYWRMRSMGKGNPSPWTRAIRFTTSPEGF